MKKYLLAATIVFVLLSCNKTADGDRKKIITTTSFITDTVKIIAGEKFEVKGLIDYGQDPHGYDPSPRDIAQVETADIIFVNGFNLEEGLLTIFENVNDKKIVQLSRGILPLEAEDHDTDEDHEDHEVDPHTWMSPLNVIKWVETINDELIRLSPENRDFFAANSRSYIEELNQLHEEILQQVSVLDLHKRIMVTDHESFAYFANEYQFSISGTIIPGFSSNSETSAKSIVELINKVRENNIPAIFIGETSGSDIVKLSENIRSETGSAVKIIPLKTASLDPEGTETDTYIKYMKYNVNRIVSGLSE